MLQLTGTWTTDKLDAFLAAPQAMVPSTSMAFEGITDLAARKAIIDYLKTLTN